MESPNPPSQTQNGDMEAWEGPEVYLCTKDTSLSTLLADESFDHTGSPIPVEYSKLRDTKASANTKLSGRLSRDDLKAIRHLLAPIAMNWENENSTYYHYHQSPIPHEHMGLEGAATVPIKLNLPEGESIDSFAGYKALRNNDFTAGRLTPRSNPHDFERWRILDTRGRLVKSYPARYIVWQRPQTKRLYARIPKPLDGMSRGFCDHCRIHDPERAGEEVDYMDDRPHIDGIRAMSVWDTAITPFSLCRFHWWYVWSGELLRLSHVHALEMLVSGDLRERWGISHMREFLRFMDFLSRRPDDDDQSGRANLLLLDEAGGAVVNRAENSSLPNVPRATVASTDAQQTVPGGEQASTTTADGPNDTSASDQSLAVARERISDELKRLDELARVGPGARTDPIRRAVFELPMRAHLRRGMLSRIPDTAIGQEINGLASQHTNGDSQTMEDIHNQPSVTSSAPALESHNSDAVEPPEPPPMYGQSTSTGSYAFVAGADARGRPAFEANGFAAFNPVTTGPHQQSNNAPAFHANGFVASRPVVPVPQPQTYGMPAPRNDELLYSPPRGPRATRWATRGQGSRRARRGSRRP